MKKKLLILLALIASLNSYSGEKKYPYKSNDRTLFGTHFHFYPPELTTEGQIFMDDLERESTDYDCISNISMKIKSRSLDNGKFSIRSRKSCSIEIELLKDGKKELLKFSDQDGYFSGTGLDMVLILPVIAAKLSIKNDCAHYNPYIRDIYDMANRGSLFCSQK